MKLRQKLIATTLVVIMLMGYISILKDAVVAASVNLVGQNSKTNNANVEFNSYFEGEDHSKTFEIGQEAKLYVKVKVSNTGYLKNGLVQFVNGNFEIDTSKLNSDKVQSSTKNEIKLKQINNSNNDVVIEVPIVILTGESVDSNLFNKTSTVKFTGTYIDQNGKENTISKEITNQLQWSGTAEIDLTGEVSKYIPYQIGEQKGVLVQAKIKSGLKQNTLPVQKTKLEVSIPEIKISEESSVNPERVTVLANTTKGTNGEGANQFGQANYSYNEQTGKIEIEVNNNEKDGKIAWNKNAQDEYLVNYIYTGEEVYNYVQEQLQKAQETIKTQEQKAAGEVNENAITGQIEVQAHIEAYNNEATKLDKTQKINYNIEKANGNIVDASVSVTNKISKGYIYANFAKAQKKASNQKIEAKKDTEYVVTYVAQINDITLTDSVEFTAKAEEYLDSEKNTYNSNTSIYTKAVKISEAVFSKMLGEDGKLEITDKEGNKLAEITKQTEKDTEGNYVANIAQANVNEITVKTSKPICEGNIEIALEKAIKASQSFTKAKMESFKEMALEVTTKACETLVKTNATAQLIEPVSKAQINILTQNLSTVVTNKDVELRVVLDTSSNENALYKNPVLQIVLPENIEKLDIKSVELFLEDELKVKTYKVTEQNGRKVILITLEGTQTKYMDNGASSQTTQKNVIAKGANIIIKADITFKKLTPSSNADILLNYTNENSNLFEKTQSQTSGKVAGLATTNVEIVSPTGVITENNMSGYNGFNAISNITAEKQEQTINAHGEAKQVTIGGTIVNNYANSIENVLVLGRIPFEGNKQIDTVQELGSNFTMKMQSKITTSGIDTSKVKVYYSTNPDATKDLANSENAWVEEVESLDAVKSYLIVITGNVEKATQFKFEYKAELPANLAYGKSTYTTYKVYYDNKIEQATVNETKLAGTIGLTTGEGPELTAKLESTVDPLVRVGQIVKMKVTVENTGTVAAENVKVNIPLPEGAEFVELIPTVGFETKSDQAKIITIGTIKPKEVKQTYYYIKFVELTTVDDEETTEEVERHQKEITHKIKVTAQKLTNIINSNEYKFYLESGDFNIELITTGNEGEVVQKGDTIQFSVSILNISHKAQLENTVVTIPLPNGTKYISSEIRNGWLENETTDEVVYNEETNTLTVNIATMGTQKKMKIFIKVEEVEPKIAIMVKVKADGIEEHCSNVAEFSIEEVSLEISQLTSTPRYVKEGENITYTLELVNKGNSTINRIKVVDQLPEDLEFIEAKYTKGDSNILIPTLTDGKVEVYIGMLSVESTATIKVIAKAKALPDQNDKEVRNVMAITANNYSGSTTNTVTNIIEYNPKLHEQTEPTNPENPTNPSDPQVEHYKITGTAWVDTNKDGKRDETEELLAGVQVMLIYKSNSQLVTDPDSNEPKITTTNENGKYEFANIQAGEYLVIFLYDAGKYSITEYQTEKVEEGYNSDAINMKIILDGEQRYAGVTDTVEIIDTNARDIDIGVYIAEKFDLKLDKYISKVTVTTKSSGTKVYNYNNAKLIKKDLYGKDINNSTAIIEYRIVVTNEGQIAGYAKKLIDYLPDDVKFSSELNKDWYIADNNGTVYNTSLANEKIEPGQSKEVTLILSVSITEKMIGNMINNNAEIYESYNEQGVPDIDSVPANRLESEDDMSNADIIFSIATGKAIIYTTLVLAIITLLGMGIFGIKKYVLNKKNNW